LKKQSYLFDAKSKGAALTGINPNNEDFSQPLQDKIPPTLVLNPTEE
jgi:hypothetical protein